MGKREESRRAMLEELKLAFENDRRESESHKRGAFGIEADASAIAVRVERELIEEKLKEYDRGYEGNTRKCPACGKLSQRYKGDNPRKIELESGAFEFLRSYYFCEGCKKGSYPMDEQLGLVEGKEQGRLRRKLNMLALISPYNQAPDICETMFGCDRYSTNLRRRLLREEKVYSKSESGNISLPISHNETVYLQIDGHMCPTREERESPTDQGFREAKAVLGYHGSDVVKVSKDRNVITRRVLKAEITSAEDFLPTVRDVYHQVNAPKAKNVVVLADGAKWIWNLVEEVAPEAIQILDFAHAKQHLYDFAKIRFSYEPAKVKPWVDEQTDRLFADEVQKVIDEMKTFSDLDKNLENVVTYFENNRHRVKYGSFRARGFTIGSGAIESAGKQLSLSRVKGAGMRWNVVDLNPLLKMKAALIDGSWKHFWKNQEKAAA